MKASGKILALMLALIQIASVFMYVSVPVNGNQPLAMGGGYICSKGLEVKNPANSDVIVTQSRPTSAPSANSVYHKPAVSYNGISYNEGSGQEISFAKLKKTAGISSSADSSVKINISVEGERINPPPNPVFMVLVLDMSSSMVVNNSMGNGKTRLQVLREAAVEFVNGYFNAEFDSSRNYISIVTYSTRRQEILGWTNNKNQALNAINGLSQTQSATNIEAGLMGAIKLLDDTRTFFNAGQPLSGVDPASCSYNVLTMTDGGANTSYSNNRPALNWNSYVNYARNNASTASVSTTISGTTSAAFSHSSRAITAGNILKMGTASIRPTVYSVVFGIYSSTPASSTSSPLDGNKVLEVMRRVSSSGGTNANTTVNTNTSLSNESDNSYLFTSGTNSQLAINLFENVQATINSPSIDAGAIIRDTIPGHFEIDSGEGRIYIDGSKILSVEIDPSNIKRNADGDWEVDWEIPLALGKGGRAELDISVRVSPNCFDSLECEYEGVSSVAWLEYTNVLNGSNEKFRPFFPIPEVHVPIPLPEISVTKEVKVKTSDFDNPQWTQLPLGYSDGDVAIFRVSVSNIGNANATGVELTDTWSGEAVEIEYLGECLSEVLEPGTERGGISSPVIFDIAAGETKEFFFSALLNGKDISDDFQAAYDNWIDGGSIGEFQFTPGSGSSKEYTNRAQVEYQYSYTHPKTGQNITVGGPVYDEVVVEVGPYYGFVRVSKQVRRDGETQWHNAIRFDYRGGIAEYKIEIENVGTKTYTLLLSDEFDEIPVDLTTANVVGGTITSVPGGVEMVVEAGDVVEIFYSVSIPKNEMGREIIHRNYFTCEYDTYFSHTRESDILVDPEPIHDLQVIKEVSVDGGITWDNEAEVEYFMPLYADYRVQIENRGNIKVETLLQDSMTVMRQPRFEIVAGEIKYTYYSVYIDPVTFGTDPLNTRVTNTASIRYFDKAASQIEKTSEAEVVFRPKNYDVSISKYVKITQDGAGSWEKEAEFADSFAGIADYKVVLTNEGNIDASVYFTDDNSPEKSRAYDIAIGDQQEIYYSTYIEPNFDDIKRVYRSQASVEYIDADGYGRKKYDEVEVTVPAIDPSLMGAIDITVVGKQNDTNGDKLFTFVLHTAPNIADVQIIDVAKDLPIFSGWRLKAGQEDKGIFVPDADRTVEFYYEQSDAQVFIKAVLEDGLTAVPGFDIIEQRATIGEYFSYDAPFITGYVLADGQNLVKKINVTGHSEEITFRYRRQDGNVTVLLKENDTYGRVFAALSYEIKDGETRTIPVKDLRESFYIALSSPKTITYKGEPIIIEYYYERETVEVIKRTYHKDDIGNPGAEHIQETNMGRYRAGEVAKFYAPAKADMNLCRENSVSPKHVLIEPPLVTRASPEYKEITFFYEEPEDGTLTVEAVDYNSGGILHSYRTQAPDGTILVVEALEVDGYILKPGEPSRKAKEVPGKVQFWYVSNLHNLDVEVRYSQNGLPVVGAEVTITSELKQIIRTTDKTGRFTETFLPTDIYAVTAKYDKYKSTIQNVILEDDHSVVFFIDISDDDDNEEIMPDGTHKPYIYGYEDGTVRPDSYMTRAEAAAIFYRLLEEKPLEVKSQFSDVDENAWYAHSVNTLAALGVLKGYGDGKFRPYNTITRAELTAIACRMEGLAKRNVDAFKDVGISHWAYGYIGAAYESKWIAGYPSGEFKPDNPITRAETISLINREKGRRIRRQDIPDNANIFKDLKKDHWAYHYIIEASVEHNFVTGNDGYEKWTSYKIK